MTRLHHIILALGSNTQQATVMREARKLLSALFPDIEFTHVMWTEPIGMEGEPFQNCLAHATTCLDVQEVERKLKEVEVLCGRTREESLRNVIRMDVDLLRYDNYRCHEQDWDRPYVHQLMKEIK